MSDTSFCVSEAHESLRLDARGFDIIKDARHRRYVLEVVERGYLRDALKLIDAHVLPDGSPVAAYVPRLRRDHVDGFAERLERELDQFGLRCPPDLMQQMMAMRALMVPLDDDELAFALSRTWLIGPWLDDVCESSSEFSLMSLRTGAGRGDNTALLKYSDFMFAELERLSSPRFMPVFRMMFYKSFVGTLFESHLANATMPFSEQAYEYIRGYNGFCEYWFLSAQFLGGSLDFPSNVTFWADIMPSCVTFLNDFNDLLSFYKEAIDGESFATNRLFLKSLANSAASYPDIYLRTLRSGMAAYHTIARSAAGQDGDALRHVVHYMRGFVYWSFHSPRYRWRELFPDLDYLV